LAHFGSSKGMKRLRLYVVVCTLLTVMAVPLWAATQPASAPRADRSPGAPIAATVAAITGIAISPLLATAAYGAYQYYRTPEEGRDRLPWFAQMKFWLPALLVVGAVAAKDTLGAILPPGWKQPLDVLEAVENKASGVIAAGAVVPITMIGVWGLLPNQEAAGGVDLASAGFATLTLAAFDGTVILQWLTVPFAVAIFAIVWMASHAINVLILMSPWGGVDAVLKSARLSLLGLLTITTMINPWVGAALSVVVIIISYFIAGWAFRLTVYGSLYTWDALSRGKHRFRLKPSGNAVFSSSQLENVPVRTYGKLRRNHDGSLTFVYRRWLFGPVREVALPPAPEIWISCGMFVTNLETENGPYALLLPRYDDHEENLARTYGFAGVREAGLRRAWSWLRDALVGSEPTRAY
jgi:hypothetical protein